MDKYGDEFVTLKLQKWDKVCQLLNLLPYRLYRGQMDANWGLIPSVERLYKNLNPVYSLKEVEERIISEFKRCAHLYLPSIPDENNWIEWLALIQHYGGPTRLLDFTKSFYVAAFFALEVLNEIDSAVWVVNSYRICKHLKHLGLYRTSDQKNEDQGILLNENFDESIIRPVIAFGRPFYLHERLYKQQGTFLFSLNMNYCFEDNLFGMLGKSINKEITQLDVDVESILTDKGLLNTVQNASIIKIILDHTMRKEALKDLYRMNITSATLFPGLDGYTRSLTHDISMYMY